MLEVITYLTALVGFVPPRALTLTSYVPPGLPGKTTAFCINESLITENEDIDISVPLPLSRTIPETVELPVPP